MLVWQCAWKSSRSAGLGHPNPAPSKERTDPRPCAEDELCAFGFSCMVRASLLTWDIGPGQIDDANVAMYNEQLFLLAWGLRAMLHQFDFWSKEAGGSLEIEWLRSVTQELHASVTDPRQDSWTPSLWELPLVGNTKLFCDTLLLSVQTPLGEHKWKLGSGFSWTLPYLSFSFPDFNVYIFTVINRNREYNSFFEFCGSF